MKERIKCYDCGAYLKHRKAMARAVIEELGDNVHRIFCKSCAEKRDLKTEDKISKDHSLGGFISATIAAIAAYFFIKYRTPLEAGLISYLLSVLSYFAFVALMKNSDYREKWDGMEIFTAFFASGIAQWGNLILCFIFGFPAGENILKALN